MSVRGRGGFTLTDVLVGIVVMGGMLGAVIVVYASGVQGAAVMDAHNRYHTSVTQALDRIQRDVIAARRANEAGVCTTWTPDSTSVGDGQATWVLNMPDGNCVVYDFQQATGEVQRILQPPSGAPLATDLVANRMDRMTFASCPSLGAVNPETGCVSIRLDPAPDARLGQANAAGDRPYFIITAVYRNFDN